MPDGKILLLKAMVILAIKDEEIMLVLTWEDHPLCQSFTMLKGINHAFRGEK